MEGEKKYTIRPLPSWFIFIKGEKAEETLSTPIIDFEHFLKGRQVNR